jgi:hypothetical protein
LVTVKAYPSVSTRYGEAVCVAGVRLDAEPHEWVRLFPVRFRELPRHQRFRKYQIIRLRVTKHSGDSRRETWRPDIDSIELGDFVPAGGAWERRRELLEPLIGPTMCQLNQGRANGASGHSLGLIRPAEVHKLSISAETDWSPGQRATVGQGNLLTQKTDLVKPAHAFSYQYRCEEPGCRGHAQKIVDWELGEVYRSWTYPQADLFEQIRQKWLDMMFADHRETFLFVGDMHRRPGSFLTLGTFFPERRPSAEQLRLQLTTA